MSRVRFAASQQKSDSMETGMLSPHGFATLMLVKAAPDQIDLDHAELGILLEQQLISLEQLASGAQRVHVTHDGETLLEAITRKGRREYAD
jgi:hemin uptake protein HemP